jgi:hypothetical protein
MKPRHIDNKRPNIKTFRQPLKLSDVSRGQGVALGLLRAITQLALDEPVAYLGAASPLMRFVLGLFPLGLV